MAQFNSNSDFATDAASTTANDSNTATITDWTWLFDTASDWAATITADAGAEGGKYCALAQTASGTDFPCVAMDGPGSVATGTETEVLFRFRLGALSNNSNVGRVRCDATGAPYYALNVSAAGDVRLQRWGGTNAAAHVGASVAKGLSSGTWYWARIHVTAAGSWSWRVWSGAVGDEPGTWDITGASDTGQTAGHVGIGATRHDSTPVDYDWFSAATAGDSAPSPSGGAATGRGRLVGGKLVGGNLVGVH